MKKKTFIIGAIIAVLLIAGGVSAAVVHNQQVQHQKIAAQKAADEATKKSNEKKWMGEANAAVDKAYRTKKTTDIDAAKTAIKKLNALDKKAPTDKLNLLTTVLSELTSADKLVATAEKAKSDADAKVAQEKKDAEAKAAAQTMDLNAIAKGDYSSIQGTWTGNKGDSITISGNSIKLPGTTDSYDGLISHNSMGNADILAEIDASKKSVFFNTDGQSMNVMAGEELLTFIQSGGEYQNGAGQALGTAGTISSISQDTIVLGDTGMEYFVKNNPASTITITISSSDQAAIDTAVTSAQKALDAIKLSAVSTEKSALQARLDKVSGKATNTISDMNLTQIAAGDFSSIQGTWKNENNNILIVSKTSLNYQATNQDIQRTFTFGEAMTGNFAGYTWPISTHIQAGILDLEGNGAIWFCPKGSVFTGVTDGPITLKQDAISCFAQTIGYAKYELYYRVN